MQGLCVWDDVCLQMGLCVCVCPPPLTGAAVVSSCIGMGSFITLLCVQKNIETLGEVSLGAIGCSAFAIAVTIAIILAVLALQHSRAFHVNAVGETIDTDSGKSKYRRRQDKSSGGL
eukprot:GHVQ01039189.1.p1 GENE.GHVQ01039189.1~~GHVQ01039189.1.p1  ORF type:complete len:117 (+),score=17.88 GHVQ01039189.1:305-655(+)